MSTRSKFRAASILMLMAFLAALIYVDNTRPASAATDHRNHSLAGLRWNCFHSDFVRHHTFPNYGFGKDLIAGVVQHARICTSPNHVRAMSISTLGAWKIEDGHKAGCGKWKPPIDFEELRVSTGFHDVRGNRNHSYFEIQCIKGKNHNKVLHKTARKVWLYFSDKKSHKPAPHWRSYLTVAHYHNDDEHAQVAGTLDPWNDSRTMTRRH